MSSGMPELGSKISLISKADIRYEGRLFTVDPQECTIALSNVRSFGTEDREAQIPVAPQAQVYEYILFRGSDIKDIRVLNNEPSLPNDPAIVQMLPPTIGQRPYQPQAGYTHSMMGQMGGMSGTPFNVGYNPMMGAMGMRMQPGVQDPRGGMNKPSSELLPGGLSAFTEQSPPNPIAAGAPSSTAPLANDNLPKDRSLEDGVLDFIGGGSRSTTPTSLLARKSPSIDQSSQTGHGKIGDNSNRNNMQRNNNMRDSHGSGRTSSGMSQYSDGKSKQQDHGQGAHGGARGNRGAGWINRGAMRGRGRGGGGGVRGGGGMNNSFNRNNQAGNAAPKAKNTLKFDKEYDFETANSEFEELRSQLAKTKIDGAVENEKKDDSGNETGAGEGEPEEEPEIVHYDKSKSFFDNISCEAVERSKGSQRTDWRTERKLNSETFGVSSMRRGNYRGRGYYNRGGGGGGGMYRGGNVGGNFRGYRGGGNRGQGNRNKQHPQNNAPTQTSQRTESMNAPGAPAPNNRLVSGTA